MKLKELRQFVDNLSIEMDDYSVVNGEVGYLDMGKEEDDMMYRVDKPIITLYVDKQSKEVCFFHQTQEDVKNSLKQTDGNSEGPK